MILAGDIGGIKTHLAVFKESGDQRAPHFERTYRNREYLGFEEMAKAFVAESGCAIGGAAFGVPGPVTDGYCTVPNLAWSMDSRSIARALELDRVKLINDLAATAYGIAALEPHGIEPIKSGSPRQGNAALIAPGTGLGEAIMVRDGDQYCISASEGGHADFAPRDEEQIELLRYLSKRFPHVSYEHLLSRTGLYNIYGFLMAAGFPAEPPSLTDRVLRSEEPSAAIAELGLFLKSYTKLLR